MGRIVAPYGVFGWLKIVPDTERLMAYLITTLGGLVKVTIGVNCWLKRLRFTMMSSW